MANASWENGQYKPYTYDAPQVQQSKPLEVKETETKEKEKKSGIIGKLASSLIGGE
jgi:hypothetical protein